MTRRIINLHDWAPIAPGTFLHLMGEGVRSVEVEINSEREVSLFVLQPVEPDASGEAQWDRTFLGAHQGMEKYQFNCAGNSSIEVNSDGEVWYFTNDGQYTAVEMPDEEQFTTLVGRKERSDILEDIIRRQALGLQALHAQQEAEREYWQAQMGANADPATGEFHEEPTDAPSGAESAERGQSPDAASVETKGTDKSAGA